MPHKLNINLKLITLKKILILAFIAAITIALSFAFTSCSSDDEPPIEKSLLTGKWYLSNEKGYYYDSYGERIKYDDSYTKETSDLELSFSADGTGAAKEFDDDIYEDSFTWTLSGNKLIIKDRYGEEVLIIKTLTSTTLILEDKGTDEDGTYEDIITFTKTN